jgi:molybdopterin-containing oxidoreductase family membrane subunit
MKTAEGIHLYELFQGGYSSMFWIVQAGGLVLPLILLLFKFFRKPLPIALISFFVLMAAWFKRYLIVIPTLEHPFLPVQNVPENFHHYTPTSIEITITLFAFFASLLIVTILAKLFPVISIWELAEEEGIDKKYLSEEPKN